MSKSNLTLGRRRFLQSLGLSAATVPFVVGLDSLYVKADVAAVPKKRFVHMYTPNGALYSNFRLRVQGTDTDISDGTALAHPNLILSPLQENAANIMVLDRLSYITARAEYQDPADSPDGIDHPGGHQKGIASMLTGGFLWGGTQDVGNAGLADRISLDQVLATRIFANLTKFPSIEVGVQVDENLNDRYVDKRTSYNAKIDPRTPQNDPFVLFQTLFGTPGADSGAQAKRAFLDKSVLDAAVADFGRLSSKLSKADQTLLEHHADSIRKLETQLGNVVDCGAVAPPSATGAPAFGSDQKTTHDWAMLEANFPVVGDMMMNIIVQAMACGLTNVATLLWANSETNLQYTWIPEVDYTLDKDGHHAMSHARSKYLLHIDKWYASQYNTLINRLKAVPESGGTGTLLDNSLLWWSSCLGDGAAHLSRNVPIVLAGSNGGYFRQGRNIQFNNTYTPSQWQGDAPGSDLSDDAFKAITDSRSPTKATGIRA